MREIKFRAWVTDGESYSEMYPNVQNHIGSDFGFGHMLQNTVKGLDCKVMQYTELKSIDGVEIYECDIVREVFLGFKFHVQFNTVTAQFEAVPIDENPWHAIPLFERDFIVIGNIYENPELLESL